MNDFVTQFQLLAQNGNGGGAWGLLVPLIFIMLIWYLLIMRPQRREQARRQEVLSALKKNDRVVTIGGIIGTVAGFSQEGKAEYVTLKVDENTRIKMLRTAIQGPLREEEADRDKPPE